MNRLKIVAIGFFSVLVVYILARLAIFAGVAPVQILPVEMVLKKFGLNYSFLPELFVFSGGIIGALIMAWVFENNTTAGKGILLAFVFWFIAMLVFAPVADLGLFTLRSEPGFLLALFVLGAYLIYGTLAGWLIGKLVYFESGVGDEIRFHSKQEE